MNDKLGMSIRSRVAIAVLCVATLTLYGMIAIILRYVFT